MELETLHKQKLEIQEAIDREENAIIESRKSIHWKRKHLRLIDQQIQEAKEDTPAKTLQEVSEGLK